MYNIYCFDDYLHACLVCFSHRDLQDYKEYNRILVNIITRYGSSRTSYIHRDFMLLLGGKYLLIPYFRALIHVYMCLNISPQIKVKKDFTQHLTINTDVFSFIRFLKKVLRKNVSK